jgi:cystathionine beta-lyase/cystathionine gamma-synthase
MTPDPAARSLSTATQTIHADDYLNRAQDVAPAIHVSTTFRYPDKPEDLVPVKELDVSHEPVSSPHHDSLLPYLINTTQIDTFDKHVYSRHTAPNTTRLEALLSALLGAHALTYSSGLAALHAALILLNPRRIAIGDGYHGSHGVIGLHQKVSGMQKLALDCAAEELHAGDVVLLETPLNPTGEAYEIAKYAAKAHARGAYLLVDATFGPPGLQDPFAHGADIVMHSGTKYLGGHSDMLCGVLAVKKGEWHRTLSTERTFLGSVLGSLEGWLGVRSLRTLELRVQRQSQNAGKLVAWLAGLLGQEKVVVDEGDNATHSSSGDGEMVKRVVEKIAHASLQHGDRHWLAKQMPNGYGPVFAVWMKDEGLARALPSKLRLFHHATSLGGVESLIEWRTMSDATVDTRLLRVSVGVEAWEDLRDDLLAAFVVLGRERETKA